MNFNQQQGNDGAGPKYPNQMNQPGSNSFPMLPPQLANLTPQQLQQLKNQPQFQTLMRNYMQRQQMLQQQQQQQQQQARVMPQGMQHGIQQPMQQPIQQPMQQSMQQPIQQPLQGRQQSLGPQAAQQLPHAIQQQVPPQLQQQIQQPMQPHLQQHMQRPLQQPNQQFMRQASHPQSSIPHGGPSAIPQPISVDPYQKPGMTPVENFQKYNMPTQGILQNITGYPIAGGRRVSSQQPDLVGRDKVGVELIIPPVPPENNPTNDILKKIPTRELKSLNEWSENLRKEGKEVPTDIKVYETIILKDSEYMKNNSRQLENNKSLVEKLLRNIKSYTDIKQLRMNAINLASKGHFNNSIWGEGYQGYGNGTTNTMTKLILPEQDMTESEMNKKALSNKSKHLVPIRLDFEEEKDRFKLRDTFLWDLDENIMSLENFTNELVNDYKFIPKNHAETILASIREQINDYCKIPDSPMGEIRIPIKIEITINNTQLTDQFEWDILNYENNDPEEFATIMCDEMNLPGEFSTAIAHSIREQTQLFHKALNLIGYSFDGLPVEEDEIRNHILPSLSIVTRDSNDGFYSILRNPNTVSDYSPSLIKLTQLEVERLEKEIERDSRRKRRHAMEESTSGRGTSRRNALHSGRGNIKTKTLPDLSDVPKTFRTPISSSILPGGVDLGVPEVYEYNEAFVQKAQVPNPDYKPPPILAGDRVRFQHVPTLGQFLVKIKYPRY